MAGFSSARALARVLATDRTDIDAARPRRAKLRFQAMQQMLSHVVGSRMCNSRLHSNRVLVIRQISYAKAVKSFQFEAVKILESSGQMGTPGIGRYA